MSSGDGVRERHPVSAEDAARAHHYALIGRLFHDAPDSILIAQLCRAEVESTDDGAELTRAWQVLRDACNAAYPAVLKQEYDSLFVGVGLVAFIRKVLIATLSHEEVKTELVYLAGIFIFGIIYWLISRAEHRK